MSVIPSQVIIYAALDMSWEDSVTVGGAVDLSTIMNFSDMSANGFIDYVSSSASDTATKMQVTGLDGSGIQQAPAAITLTGTTKVNGAQTFGRLLAGVSTGSTAGKALSNPGGTGAVGDLAIMSHTLIITAHTCQTGSANSTGTTPALIKLQSGDGASVTLNMIIRTTGGTGPNQIRMALSTSGTGSGQYGTDIIAVNENWGTVPDNTTTYEIATGMLFPALPNQVFCVQRPFIGITAQITGGTTNTYYEKGFVLNTNSSTAWTGATLIKQTDPNSQYSTATTELDIAPCTALNDTVTATNRQTVPGSGIGSFSSGAAPQTVTLAAQTSATNAAAQAQGFWMRMAVGAGSAPFNSSTDLRPSGSTT